MSEKKNEGIATIVVSQVAKITVFGVRDEGLARDAVVQYLEEGIYFDVGESKKIDKDTVEFEIIPEHRY